MSWYSSKTSEASTDGDFGEIGITESLQPNNLTQKSDVTLYETEKIREL